MTGRCVIGNCSGFYGDRLDAAREMVDGGPIDVLCGDYLAELTMLILAKAQAKDPALGYAKTFLTQVEDVLGTCLERGIKIVSNAGGLNPAGLAAAIRDVAAKLGLQVNVAHVEGDDLRGNLGAITPPVDGKPVSANAYLGGWGIAEALGAGADVVVTGRVTDASLVVGPAAWWHGWARDGLGRAGRRRRRRARDRVRPAGHRRQLRVPRRDHRPPLPGLPDRRGRRRRLVGDHEAPGHRRAGLGRHRHRAAALRDAGARLPGPGRHHALRHHRAGAGGRAPRRDLRGARERRRRRR